MIGDKSYSVMVGCLINWDGLFTLFRVCVCPMRMRALEEMMERQKLMRMTERSDRMYLQGDERKQRINDEWSSYWTLNIPPSSSCS